MRIARLPRFVLSLVALAGAMVALPARATLTTSERAQIKGYVSAALVENAPRVRALVARPDLSVDEASAALGEAIVPLVFNDQRAAFFRDMFTGGGSIATRPVMAVAETGALLARADALLGKYSTDLDQHLDVLDELSRIYAFIAGEIASAGHPLRSAHDPAVALPNATYEECAHRLGVHIQNNPRWLRGDARLPLDAERVRAQLQLALNEMMNDGPMRRGDTADRLGLVGARRRFLTESGILLLDSGNADDARVKRVAALAPTLASRPDVEAIAFGGGRAFVATLRARGEIIGVVVPLEVTEAPSEVAREAEEVDAGPLDLPLFVLRYELATSAVESALGHRAELRAQAERDFVRHAGAAHASGMTMEQRLATVVAQLTTDAPRTLDLAFGRFLRHRPETAALVSDALGVLANIAPPGPLGSLVLPLTRPKAAGGEPEALPGTNVRLAPSGAVVAFVLDGHRWEIQRDGAGGVIAVHRDGAPVTLAVLPTARVPLTGGNAWSGEGIVFARLYGSPHAGIGPGPRVRLVSGETHGVDAIATPSPGDDVVVEADVTARGAEGGIVVRAVSTKDAFAGASVVVVPGTPSKASLRVSEGKGREVEAGPPVDLPAATTYPVRVTVRGNTLEASVGPAKLSTTLPDSLAHGDIALRVKRGGALEANVFHVRRP